MTTTAKTDNQIIAACSPYTKTSRERLLALISATRRICDLGVIGDIVECGVWRGGSMMAAAMVLAEAGESRMIHLFDTFDGMPPPGAEDIDLAGSAAAGLLASQDKATGDVWSACPAEEVERNMASTGYPHCRLVAGMVEDTVPAEAPESIAVLRLDTDWYASTKHELEHLYPRLVSGGVLIIDDYGHWRGAKKAVDEYFGGSLRFDEIDYTGRIAIKP
jgi:O-methyltransferase